MKKVLVPRKIKNNGQIQTYVKAVQAGQKIYHVIPNDGKWVVKKALAHRSRIFNNKNEAKGYAIRVAKNAGTELIIHDKDGRISRKFYGKG